MSRMNHAAFAQCGIQELSLGEVDFVGGAVDADDVIKVGTYVAAGATLVAGVSGGPTNPVGATATVVAGLAAITIGVAMLVDND